jgi:hypothetical protein
MTLIFLALSTMNLKSQAETVAEVQVGSADWNESTNADVSYIAYRKYLESSTPKRKFGDKDYYASMQVIPQWKSFSGACNGEASEFRKFFDGFFGTTKVAMVLVTLSIAQRTGHTGQHDVISEVPLFYAGKGYDPESKKPSGSSCFFDYLRAQRSPYVRHDGSAPADFELTFKVRRNNDISSNAVATLSNALIAYSSIFNWTDLTGAQAQHLETAFTNFQNGITAAFSRDQTYPFQAKPLLTLGEKDLLYHVKASSIETATGKTLVFTRLSASILLDNINDQVITVDRVLEDPEAGATRCIPELPTPKCQVVTQTLLEAFRASDQGRTAPERFFDFSKDGQKKVLETCDNLRSFATGKLGLSTLDALLFRWAAVRYGRLDKTLADSAKANAIAHAISNASGSSVTVAELKERCWGGDDPDKLAGVIKQMGGKTLEQ